MINNQGDITSHILGLFNKTIYLLKINIIPIYVFDGKPPDIKKNTLAKRQDNRKNAEDKLLEDLTGYTNVTKQLFIMDNEDTSLGFYDFQGNIAFQYLDGYAYTLFSEINPLELSRINNPTPSLLNILLFLITGHDY